MAETTISVPLRLAQIISGAFLPVNPNKMRAASKEVIDAAHEFKRLIVEAAKNAR